MLKCSRLALGLNFSMGSDHVSFNGECGCPPCVASSFSSVLSSGAFKSENRELPCQLTTSRGEMSRCDQL